MASGAGFCVAVTIKSHRALVYLNSSLLGANVVSKAHTD